MGDAKSTGELIGFEIDVAKRLGQDLGLKANCSDRMGWHYSSTFGEKV